MSKSILYFYMIQYSFWLISFCTFVFLVGISFRKKYEFIRDQIDGLFLSIMIFSVCARQTRNGDWPLGFVTTIFVIFAVLFVRRTISIILEIIKRQKQKDNSEI